MQQNLGAMIRSAYCLGATGVLVCNKNSAPLSATVSKASAGVMELVPLNNCRSMPRTLLDAVQRGWAVVGAAAGPGAVPLSSYQVQGPTVLVMGTWLGQRRLTVLATLRGWGNLHWSVLLLLPNEMSHTSTHAPPHTHTQTHSLLTHAWPGNEGYGLRTTVERSCTSMVAIEMNLPDGGVQAGGRQLVDSLNVSVATGILLHHMLAAAKPAEAAAAPAE